MKLSVLLSAVTLGMLLAMCGPAQAQDGALGECIELANMSTGTLDRAQHIPSMRGEFFANKMAAQGFEAAQKDATSAQQLMKQVPPGQDSVPYLAGAMLGAIVTGNTSLLEATYNANVEHYFLSKDVFMPLTMSAACNFRQGVTYLLRRGASPNAGDDLGAFNIALYRHDNSMLKALLDHGYKIDSTTKRCDSTQYIIKHSITSFPTFVTDALAHSPCGKH